MDNFDGKMVKRIDRNKKKNKKGIKIAIISVCSVLLLGIGLGGVYVHNTLGSLKQKEIPKEEKKEIKDSIDPKITEKYEKKGITNIALLGVDRRVEDTGRSDATMVLTIDKEHDKIKITSILRDSRVTIDGHGKDKLNHAFAFGGPVLSIKTLNQNFGLNITDYVVVDFAELVNIIEALGGVELDVKKSEFNETNKYIGDVCKETKKTSELLKAPGIQVLNGVQAVAYCRIRYNDNDLARTDRQREVLVALFNKLKKTSPTKLPDIVKKIGPYLETSLSTTSIINLGVDAIQSNINNIGQQIFPIEGYDNTKGGIASDKIFYWQFDADSLKNRIDKYIFEDASPTGK